MYVCIFRSTKYDSLSEWMNGFPLKLMKICIKVHKTKPKWKKNLYIITNKISTYVCVLYVHMCMKKENFLETQKAKKYKRHCNILYEWIYDDDDDGRYESMQEFCAKVYSFITVTFK